jgi:hypothetical protein
MRKLAALICFMVMLAFGIVSIAQTLDRDETPPPTVDDTRPTPEWDVWYLDGEGEKKLEIVATWYPQDALAIFIANHNGEIYTIVCLNQPHWQRCEDR